MLKKTLVIPCLLMALSVICQQKVSIIPQPVSLDIHDGYFVIDASTPLNYDKGNAELARVAVFFRNYIREISGYSLPENKPAGKAIRLSMTNDKAIGKEGYHLTVNNNSIRIEANTSGGLIYAMQSLFQTLPAIRTNADLKIPQMKITDYPSFAYRGMHLDVCRHFFSPAFVKEYIDLMVTFKFNTFHWHLTDDQGWRIEIKKYPKLTSLGAWRVDRSDKTWDLRERAKPGEEASYGGFYTQEQVKDIVKYAQERNITIIPEIEMPGHAEAAIASYPYLSCSQQPQLVITGGQYPKEYLTNFCAGNDSVFLFLENVLTEVLSLFPSTYIHIGGDEVDKTSWKTCPKCQARMKAEGLGNVDELQSYFIRRMEKFLVSKKRKLLGWDEILEGGLAPEATVMSWRGETGGIQAAKMGHDVVMTPGNPLYFDTYQAGPEGEPVAIGGFNTLRNVYSYNPVPKELNAAEGKHVLGAQANVWTEFIKTPSHVEYMVLPRMLALAEVLWSPGEQRNWENFYERLQSRFTAFDQKGYRYSKGNYTVAIVPQSENGKLAVTLSSDIPSAKIYYTTDNSTPSIESRLYAQPLLIDSSIILKASIELNGEIMGQKPAEQNFVMHKAIGRDVIYENKPSSFYMANGINSLTDGVRGGSAVTKYWHGFNGQDLVATIDLGSNITVQSVSTGFLQHYKDWIFMPAEVQYKVSVDGKNFRDVGTARNDISENNKESVIKDFGVTFAPADVRFVRVYAKVLRSIPKGHPGEGQPAWLFADEIVVR